MSATIYVPEFAAAAPEAIPEAPPQVPFIDADPTVDYFVGVKEISADQIRQFPSGPVHAEVRVMQPDGSEAAVIVRVPTGVKILGAPGDDPSYVKKNGTVASYSVFSKTPRAVTKREEAVDTAQSQRVRATGAHRRQPENQEGWFKRTVIRRLGRLLVQPMLTEDAPDTILADMEAVEAQIARNRQEARITTADAPAPTRYPSAEIGLAFHWRMSPSEAAMEAPASAPRGSNLTGAFAGAAAGREEVAARRPKVYAEATRYDEQDLPVEEGVVSNLIDRALVPFNTNIDSALATNDFGALAAAFNSVKQELMAEAAHGSANANVLLARLEAFAVQVQPLARGQHLGALVTVIDLQADTLTAQPR